MLERCNGFLTGRLLISAEIVYCSSPFDALACSNRNMPEVGKIRAVNANFVGILSERSFWVKEGQVLSFNGNNKFSKVTEINIL